MLGKSIGGQKKRTPRQHEANGERGRNSGNGHAADCKMNAQPASKGLAELGIFDFRVQDVVEREAGNGVPICFALTTLGAGQETTRYPS